MSRTLRIFLIPLLALLAVMAWPLSAHADDDPSPWWEITRYDVTATLDEEGMTDVRVEMDFDFMGEPGHGPFVTLPERQAVPGNKDLWRDIPVSDISASSPTGAPADTHVERNSDGVMIKVGDPGITVDGQQTYVIEYTVAGLPNPHAGGSDIDQLGWNVIGPYWEVPLNDISVTVNGPAEVQNAACFAGDVDSTSPCADAASSGTTATYRHDRLAPGDGLTIATDYPGGTLPETAVTYSRRVHLGNMFELSPISGIGTAITALAGVAGVTSLRRSKRDKAFSGMVPGLSPGHGQSADVEDRRKTPVTVRFEPPTERNPGLLGTLIDARVDDRDLTATIIDLAVRGHLKVEQVDQINYRLHRTAPVNSDRLLPHESRLMSGLFGHGNVFDMRVVKGNQNLAKRIANGMEQSRSRLYSGAQQLGWFRHNPRIMRLSWLLIGLAIAGVGALMTLALGTRGHGLIGIPVAVTGLAIAGVSQQLTARTPEGSAMLDQLLGFREYLMTAEADQLRWEEGEDIFSKYLPYAIMFNCADRWTKVFEDLRARGVYTVEPTWFHGYSMGYGWGNMAGLSNISTGLSSAISSSISQAASTASAGSGGGFAGGVGGGVGGGGGGGW